jgi:hypothetical protein
MENVSGAVKVVLSLTDHDNGYGQHLLMIERDGPHWDNWGSCLILTDNELDKLVTLINDYRAAGMASEEFADDSGRTP